MSTIAAREAISNSKEAAKKEDIYTCIHSGSQFFYYFYLCKIHNFTKIIYYT